MQIANQQSQQLSLNHNNLVHTPKGQQVLKISKKNITFKDSQYQSHKKVLNTNGSYTTAAASHKISPDNSRATIDTIEQFQKRKKKKAEVLSNKKRIKSVYNAATSRYQNGNNNETLQHQDQNQSKSNKNLNGQLESLIHSDSIPIPNIKHSIQSASNARKKSISIPGNGSILPDNLKNQTAQNQSEDRKKPTQHQSSQAITIKTHGLTENDNVLNQLSNIVRDEQLVFKLCFDQNRVQKHMRLKSIQEQLDSFIYKRIGDKRGLKEKAISKRNQLLDPLFLEELYKDRMEKKFRSKDTNQNTLNNSIDEGKTPKGRNFLEEILSPKLLPKNQAQTMDNQKEQKLVLPMITNWKQKLEIKRQHDRQMAMDHKSARQNNELRSENSSSSSENSVIRKLNMGKSKHLTDLYKRMYAEMTNKTERKLKKLQKNKSVSDSFSSFEDINVVEQDESVGNYYSDDQEDDNLFVTKLPDATQKHSIAEQNYASNQSFRRMSGQQQHSNHHNNEPSSLFNPNKNHLPSHFNQSHHSINHNSGINGNHTGSKNDSTNITNTNQNFPSTKKKSMFKSQSTKKLHVRIQSRQQL
ncbi:UNKNOWN [Stylonychia lemnae]|uniref:Uncharacterized protein n=1 Tax=Stylonychia lemnae TaxID=5949 RepID=A0A078ADV5_STYLE|nr:UNKNOWN [Stylonychia lemnae]|eukprot:CDW79093.1 UNKNOWN [Stylonychia lemnae]